MQENRKITSFFKTTSQIEESESDSSSDVAININEVESDILKYERILNSKEELKNKTKIVLIKKTAGGSPVWNYFGRMVMQKKVVLNKYYICKMCFEETPVHIKGFGVSTSTSNLSLHLRNAHNLNLTSKIAESSNKKTKAILSGKNNLIERPDTHKFANARLLVQMCCKDLRPFNMVEQPGFINYMKAIKPNIKMPCATTLSRSALEDVYSTYEKTIKDFLVENSPKNISLVLDMWTDSYKRRSYINIKIIFCHKFKPVYISLKTEIFPHPHNQITIAENINKTLKDFLLDKKEIVVVSDGASNIVAAMKINGMKRLGCSIHSLHRLIVHDILKNTEFNVFRDVVKKLKIIFKCLNYNTENISKIQKAFEEDDIFNTLNEATNIYNVIETDEQFQFLTDDIDCNIVTKSLGTLKNSNDTRWNTLCYMFRSFAKNEKVVNIALVEIGKTELALNQMEKLMVSEFLKFLEIFEKATKHLQGRKYPTITCNIVFFENIVDDLHENSTTASFEESINLYNFAIINFPKRFKIFKIHVVAALLDPVQKNWDRLDKWLKKIPAKEYMDMYEELKYDDIDGGISRNHLILNEVRKIDENSVNEEIPTSSCMIKRRKQDTNSSHSTIASFVQATSNTKQEDYIQKEVAKYFAVSYDDTDTYNWWQKNENEYPNVAKLAASILTLPSTSASSEEAFSSAGSLITAKRSNLNGVTVKRVLFIHDNYDLVNELMK